MKFFDTLIARSRSKNNGYRKGVSDERKKNKLEIAQLKKELRMTKAKYLNMERQLNKNYIDEVREVVALKHKVLNIENEYRILLIKFKAQVKELFNRTRNILEDGAVLFDYIEHLKNKEIVSMVDNKIENKLQLIQHKKISGIK